jgi:hypothetical protein
MFGLFGTGGNIIVLEIGADSRRLCAKACCIGHCGIHGKALQPVQHRRLPEVIDD